MIPLANNSIKEGKWYGEIHGGGAVYKKTLGIWVVRIART
jgi:hypothetical protein